MKNGVAIASTLPQMDWGAIIVMAKLAVQNKASNNPS